MVRACIPHCDRHICLYPIPQLISHIFLHTMTLWHCQHMPTCHYWFQRCTLPPVPTTSLLIQHIAMDIHQFCSIQFLTGPLTVYTALTVVTKLYIGKFGMVRYFRNEVVEIRRRFCKFSGWRPISSQFDMSLRLDTAEVFGRWLPNKKPIRSWLGMKSSMDLRNTYGTE